MVSSLQVLIVTMNQKRDNSLLSRMNIQSDAIVGNQCDRNEIIDEEYNGYKVKWLNFCEKGVGLNRNNILMRSSADILVFADDDMVFDDGYVSKVLELFNKYKKADVLIFNLKSEDNKRNNNKKNKYTKKTFYGCARIAVRRESVIKNGIFFNLCFGGGARYSCGEDSLFLTDCKRKKLKILLVTDSIATLLNERESTWYRGKNEKLYKDEGTLFAAAKIRPFYLRCIKAAYICKKNDKDRGFFEILKLILLGKKEFDKLGG